CCPYDTRDDDDQDRYEPTLHASSSNGRLTAICGTRSAGKGRDTRARNSLFHRLRIRCCQVSVDRRLLPCLNVHRDSAAPSLHRGALIDTGFDYRARAAVRAMPSLTTLDPKKLRSWARNLTPPASS